MVVDKRNALGWLRKHLDEAGPDLLREMLKAMVETLMGAEAGSICSVGYARSALGR